MRLIRSVAVFAAASMVAVPALAASANQAAGLSLSSDAPATGSTATKHSGKLAGSTVVLIGVAAAAVVGGAVALGTRHHHDSMPASS